MICKKCNYILSGSESFCPDCGTPCVKEKEVPQERESSSIFTSEKETSSPIFSDEAPVYRHAEKKKSKAGVYLVVVLCLVIIGTVAVTVTDIMDLTPVVSSLISSVAEKVTQEPSPSEYDPLSGVISPSVTYKTVKAYITGEKGQPLRKGPDNYYGQLSTLPAGTNVHIIGTTGTQSHWLYVYVPESDLYGWLSASFLSSFGAEDKPELSEEAQKTEKVDETTEESTVQ